MFKWCLYTTKIPPTKSYRNRPAQGEAWLLKCKAELKATDAMVVEILKKKTTNKRATSMDLRGFDLDWWSNSMKIVKFESSFDFWESFGGDVHRNTKDDTPRIVCWVWKERNIRKSLKSRSCCWHWLVVLGASWSLFVGSLIYHVLLKH